MTPLMDLLHSSVTRTHKFWTTRQYMKVEFSLTRFEPYHLIEIVWPSKPILTHIRILHRVYGDLALGRAGYAFHGISELPFVFAGAFEAPTDPVPSRHRYEFSTW